MNKGINEIVLRNRPAKEPMDFKRFQFICYFVAGMTAMVMAFIAAYMIIYFCGTAGR